jgi:hypothetical protein
VLCAARSRDADPGIVLAAAGENRRLDRPDLALDGPFRSVLAKAHVSTAALAATAHGRTRSSA